MKKGFSEAFNVTNKYIVLATPLILYSLFTSVYLAASATGKLINLLIALVLFTLMTAAFIAGWFNMIKIAIVAPQRDDANSLIKEFIPGVGEYFLSSIGSLVNIFIVTLLVVIITIYAGMHFIGNPDISVEALSKSLETAITLKTFLASLSTEQLVKLNQWNILLMSGISFAYFILLLYLPALFFKKKNPFMALVVSFKDLFSKHILKTFGIYVLIFLANAIISILSALFIGNVVMHFILTLANFYFVTVAAVGVFYYYFKTFIEPQIGQNVDLRV